MMLLALAAASAAAQGLAFARLGVVGAAAFGLAATFAQGRSAPSERPAPALDARPRRVSSKLAAELSYFLDPHSRELTTDDVGNLGPMLVGNV
jgi:hypothetical protein